MHGRSEKSSSSEVICHSIKAHVENGFKTIATCCAANYQLVEQHNQHDDEHDRDDNDADDDDAVMMEMFL